MAEMLLLLVAVLTAADLAGAASPVGQSMGRLLEPSAKGLLLWQLQRYLEHQALMVQMGRQQLVHLGLQVRERLHLQSSMLVELHPGLCQPYQLWGSQVGRLKWYNATASGIRPRRA